MDKTEPPEIAMARRIRRQAKMCRDLGSSLYEMLLESAAEDVETRGPCWAVLEPYQSLPVGSARSLRFMGAVHRLVLKGRLTELARFYPSAGGIADDPHACCAAFRQAIEDNIKALQEEMNHPVQTNEAGRSRALLGGFLTAARQTRLSLRLLELGSSAGLNLRWDQYRYESGAHSWGEPEAALRFIDVFSGSVPPLDVNVRIAERMGCDPAPLDPQNPEDCLIAQSFIWPDQTHRLATMRNALDIARRVPARVERGTAREWLPKNLSERAAGAASVVFHSIVMQYMSDDERAWLTQFMNDAGRAATPDSPVAWLRMEPTASQTHVVLTVWPPGKERLLAKAGYHGEYVDWL